MAPKEVKRQLTTVYSRVVGWFAPITAFNPGAKAQYDNRKGYNNISKGNSEKL